MRLMPNKKVIMLFLILITGLGIGYYVSAEAKDKDSPSVDTQPMPVTVTIVKPESVQIWKEFSAKLEAVEYAEIKPQVSGVVTDIKFKDGAEVKKGDILYMVDSRPYQAAVDKAQADLKSAYNETDLAQKELNRTKKLIEVDAISKRIYDERASALKVSQSKAESIKAQLEQAKINLDYANIRAPISGKISRAEIKVGNLVEAGPNAPLLTSIVSTDGIYADFEIDDQTYLNQVRKNNVSDDQMIPVKLVLNSGEKKYDGFVQSFDNRINPDSGTIRVRALFSNEDKVLLPGMFSTIEMGSAAPEKQIIVTERAISTDQDRKFVYVVNNENKVTYRPIKIGDSTDGKRIILSGLGEGDRVITDGIIRLRPDMVVDPKIEQEPKISTPSQKNIN